MSDNLEFTTPYMLKRGSELLKCGEVHPYIKMFYESNFVDNLYHLIYVHPEFLEWFYVHSTNNIKQLIILFIKQLYNSYNNIFNSYNNIDNIREEIESLINKLNITTDEKINSDNLEATFELLNYATNQEYCRVRTSNYRYKSGGDNGEIYFRISSINYNWFNDIWQVVAEFFNQIKNVTIMKDQQTFGKQFDYITIKGTPIDHMSAEAFLSIPGNPLVEQLRTQINNKSNKDIKDSMSLQENKNYKVEETVDFISFPDYNELTESFTNNEEEQVVNEDIEKHDNLNPKLFDENNHLKPEVHDKIIEIVNEFVNGLKEDGIKINVKDIKLVGSNCSYNYNKDSDLDVHIVADTKSLECPDDLYPLLYSAYRSIWNSKLDIDFYGIPVELYVETIDDEIDVDSEPLQEASNSLYIGLPVTMNHDRFKTFSNEKAMDKHKNSNNSYRYQYYEVPRDEFKSLKKQGNNDLKAFSKLQDEGRVFEENLTEAAQENAVKSNGLYSVLKDKWIKEPVQTDIPDIDMEEFEKQFQVWEDRYFEIANTESIEDIENFIEDIYDLRKSSIANDGEYGLGNLVFKECRALGYLDSLKDRKNYLKGRQLSLEQLGE